MFQGTKNTRYDGRHLLDSQQGENQNPKHGRFKKVNDLTILLMFFLIRKLYFPLKILTFDQFLPSYKESFLFLEILWGFIIICSKINSLVTLIKFLVE